MPRLVTVAKVTLMGLPSSGRVGPQQLSERKQLRTAASTSGTRRVDAPDDSDSDTDDYYAELSSSSSDSCIDYRIVKFV